MARNCSLTTGTFNRVVKDRTALRLSGANSVQRSRHTKVPTACPRNFATIQGAAERCQPIHPTGFPDVFHIFHIGNFQLGERDAESKKRLGHAQPYGLPLLLSKLIPETGYRLRLALLRARKGGRLKIEKRSYRLEVPCFEGTLQEFKIPESKFRGRNESSATFSQSALKILDAGQRRELQQIPAQPHICSR